MTKIIKLIDKMYARNMPIWLETSIYTKNKPHRVDVELIKLERYIILSHDK